MPKIGKKTKSEADLLKALAAAWEAFENPADWKRSKGNGNLWRVWDGVTVVIFRNRGGYVFCITDGEGTRFSEEPFETEADAMSALGHEVGVGFDEAEAMRR